MNPIKILVADDHAPFRQLLLEFLRSRPGIEVVGIATDGLEAVEQSKHLRPDLVLMDISMPRLSGFEATRQIKQEHPDTRVVILSSHSGDVYRSAAVASQADGYIEKSSMKSALVKMLGENHRSDNVRVAI